MYRVVISAAPFLLPLMFQVGFGWSPVLAGGLVLLLFVGNLAVKPATSPLIRRFGFRAVLIGSIAAGGVVFGLLATLSAASPLPWVAALLLLSGVFRSVGFSGYNSLQFADIDAGRMSDANTLASTVQQVAAALGIALGAVTVRLADRSLGSSALPDWPYRVAFVVLGLLMIPPLVGALRLHRSAGDEVAGRTDVLGGPAQPGAAGTHHTEPDRRGDERQRHHPQRLAPDPEAAQHEQREPDDDQHDHGPTGSHQARRHEERGEYEHRDQGQSAQDVPDDRSLCPGP